MSIIISCCIVLYHSTNIIAMALTPRLIFFLLFAAIAKAADMSKISSVLIDNHEIDEWRLRAGRPVPALKRVVVWRRDAMVGIGNALGSFSQVVKLALAEDRKLVIDSIIFQKVFRLTRCASCSCSCLIAPNTRQFCEIVNCTIKALPGES